MKTESTKTIRDILTDGFRQGHIFLNALGTAADRKPGKNNMKILRRAIDDKDYYKIRSILDTCRG